MKKAIALVAMLMTTGCATIIQGGPDRVSVNSEPQGAKVFLNNNPVGVTPMQLSVKRSDNFNIRVEKEGFNSYQEDRGKVVAGWVFADIIWWPSVIVDLATHSQGKYSEDPIYARLSKDERVPASQ